MKIRIVCVVVGFLSLVLCVAAQTSGSSPASAQVPPPLIQLSNVANDEGGNSLSGLVNITFSLYSSQQGGEPLWTETQNNVQLDPTGHYSVQLGITKPNGVPTALFTSGEARWLGVQIAEQVEQPRILLLSVPYALKAGDAATIGGLPPSAFVLAAPAGGTAASESVSTASAASGVTPAVGGTGTTDFIPLWTDSVGDLGNSALFQSGTSPTAKLGINTTTPATTLDVKGAGTIRGSLTTLGTLLLPATGPGTATTGKNSEPLNLAASAFNSTSSTAVNQTFQWQAEPAGNDTSTPSGTLNLLFGEGTTKPSETGLHIASNGQITFATGQTFPGTGTGDGTVTSVGSGLGLTGGPITGSGTLSIDTTKVPLLAAANTFTANQTVNGTVTATSFSGNGAGLTQVKAANSKLLGGIGPGAFARLDEPNIFTYTQTFNNTTIISGANTAGILQVTNTATSGKAPAIVGTTDSSAAAGIKGIVAATSGTEAGVVGQTSSTQGDGVLGQGPFVGVYGTSSGSSATGAGHGNAGVWGDTGGAADSGYAGVLGTADGNSAGWFLNNGASSTVVATNSGGGSAGLFFNDGNSGAYFGYTLYVEQDDLCDDCQIFAAAAGPDFDDWCGIDVTASFSCYNGTDVIIVNSGTRKVALNSVLSTEHWFEDAGSGQLSNGSARIELDPTFARTVNTGVEYHVFLTPKGDCKGLYVTNETATGFEVHELGGGSSSIAFDYRIMAKRVGYENVRLKDLTERMNKMAVAHKMMQRPVRPSAVPQASPVAQISPMRAAAQPVTAQPQVRVVGR